MRKITFAFLFLTFALVGGVVFAQATRNVCSQVYEENKETIQAYDSNGNGKIEKEELDKAVNDWLYQVGKVSDSQLLGLVKFSYLGCTGPVSPSPVPSPSPAPSPTPVATLKVISPNGGEKWEAGKTYEIKWSQSGLEGRTVNISLIKFDYVCERVCVLRIPLIFGSWCVKYDTRCSEKNKSVTSIAQDIPAEQGTYSWTIPGGLNEKARYYVEIESFISTPLPTPPVPTTTASVIRIADRSDGPFFIISPVKTLKVISPNGGEKWEAGKTYEIKWSQTGLEGQKIGIYLDQYCLTPGLKCSLENIEKCVTPERKLIAQVEADQGTYSWTIPQELGDKRCLCFVLIKQDENIFDRSDRWFTISPPDIPAKGTLSVATNTVGVNQPISVTIKAEDPNGLAKVCLYRASWECKPCSIELPTCTQTFNFTENREGTYKYYGYLYGRTADGKIEPGTWTDPQSVEVQVTGAPPPPSSPSPSPTTSAEVAPRGTISVSPAVALSVRNQEIIVQIRGEDPNGVRELRLSASPSVVSAPDHQCGGATSCSSEWKFNATSFRGLGMVKFCGQVVGLKANGTDTEVVSTFPACVYVIVL
jgi:hypothetical protein